MCPKGGERGEPGHHWVGDAAAMRRLDFPDLGARDYKDGGKVAVAYPEMHFLWGKKIWGIHTSRKGQTPPGESQ